MCISSSSLGRIRCCLALTVSSYQLIYVYIPQERIIILHVPILLRPAHDMTSRLGQLSSYSPTDVVVNCALSIDIGLIRVT